MLSTTLPRAAAFLMLTGLAACSSSTEDDPAPAPAKGMSWTVDGAAQTTTTLQSQKFQSSISVAGTVPGSNAYLSLEFPNAVGTYTFSPTAVASATYVAATGPNSPAPAYYAGATGSSTVTGAGTIFITALTASSVQGTFTFTGINANTGAAKSITNGTFNVGL